MSRLDTIVVSRMISILALSVFAGCADDPAMPEGEHRLQVSAVAPGGSQLVTGAASDFSIRLDEVLLVLGEVKLETAGVDGTVDFVDQRSVVLPLSLVDGEPVLAFDLDAPAGTYKELEISVDKLVVGHLTENPLIEVYPDLANASILVSGTVIRNGAEEPFVSAYDADIALELDLTPHLIVTTQNSVSRFSQLWSTCQAGSEAAPVSSWILQILRTARLSCPTFSSRSRLHCHDSVRKLAKNSRGPESEWAA